MYIQYTFLLTHNQSINQLNNTINQINLEYLFRLLRSQEAYNAVLFCIQWVIIVFTGIINLNYYQKLCVSQNTYKGSGNSWRLSGNSRLISFSQVTTKKKYLKILRVSCFLGIAVHCLMGMLLETEPEHGVSCGANHHLKTNSCSQDSKKG